MRLILIRNALARAVYKMYNNKDDRMRIIPQKEYGLNERSIRVKKSWENEEASCDTWQRCFVILEKD